MRLTSLPSDDPEEDAATWAKNEVYVWESRMGYAATNIVEKRPAMKPSIANRVPGRRDAIVKDRVIVMQEDSVVTERYCEGWKKCVMIRTMIKALTREVWYIWRQMRHC